MCIFQKKSTLVGTTHTTRLLHPSKAPLQPDLWVATTRALCCGFCSTSLLVCVSAEGCEVGQWSEWGTCTRRNKTCGYKWGLETRTRHIVKKPPKDTIPCPTIAESRMCKMSMRHCRRGRDVMHQYAKECAVKESVTHIQSCPCSRCTSLLNIKENSPLIPQGCSFLHSEFHLFHVTPRASQSALFLQCLCSRGVHAFATHWTVLFRGGLASASLFCSEQYFSSLVASTLQSPTVSSLECFKVQAADFSQWLFPPVSLTDICGGTQQACHSFKLEVECELVHLGLFFFFFFKVNHFSPKRAKHISWGWWPHVSSALKNKWPCP